MVIELFIVVFLMYILIEKVVFAMKNKEIRFVKVLLVFEEKKFESWERDFKNLKLPPSITPPVYFEYAVDRTSFVDQQSSSPTQQKFLTSPSVQKVAKKILGHGFADIPSTRLEVLKLMAKDRQKQGLKGKNWWVIRFPGSKLDWELNQAIKDVKSGKKKDVKLKL